LAFGCAAENAKISLLDEPAASGGTAGSSGSGNQGADAGADANTGGTVGANPEGARCIDDDDCESRRCVAFTCVRCTSDTECGGTTRYCNVDLGRCQQCLSPAQCATGQVCAAETGRCETRCVEDADCAGGNRPMCAVSSGVCVECSQKEDCTGPRPQCETRSGLCVECLTNADCGGRWCEPGEWHCEGF
jgi:Cys-rich repeat protein